MNNNTPEEDGDGGVGREISAVGDAIGDLITGIPAPIRKNALKAFARLCTAAVEYPVALIENAISEKRAESRARAKLIDTSANQIAEQMRTSPEYARAAATKFAHKIVRERVNVDQIADIAATELKSEQVAGADDAATSAPPISDDWLNIFENEAAQMSSEQMQHLFGKILAGEILKPATYSIKTIKLAAQLDSRAASLFRKLCSLSVSLRIPGLGIIWDARVVSMGNASANTLTPYGLSFDSLNILEEYGLIIPEYDSYMDYRMAVAHEGKLSIPITHQGKNWALVPKTPPVTSQEFRVSGVALSRSGKELISIVEVEADQRYLDALIESFDKQGMLMLPFA